MDDSISRAAAIDAAIEAADEWDGGHNVQRAQIIENRLKDLPAIQPKRGRWKGEGLGDYRCSLCGEVNTRTRTNYCPNCGADMREP